MSSMESKLQNLLNWGKMTSNPGASVQVTVQSGETINNVPLLQDFGFASKAAVDSVGIFMARNGAKDAGMFVNPQDRSNAPSLANGETALYNNHGATLHLKASGDLEVAGGDLLVKTGDVDAEAGVYKVASIQVVGAQQPLITPPVGGGVPGVDAPARATIGLILTTLQTHGLTL